MPIREHNKGYEKKTVLRPFCDKNKQRAKQILILQIELVHNTSLKILILYERKVGQYKRRSQRKTLENICTQFAIGTENDNHTKE